MSKMFGPPESAEDTAESRWFEEVELLIKWRWLFRSVEGGCGWSMEVEFLFEPAAPDDTLKVCIE